MLYFHQFLLNLHTLYTGVFAFYQCAVTVLQHMHLLYKYICIHVYTCIYVYGCICKSKGILVNVLIGSCTE